MGFTTVEEGEQALLYNSQGQGMLIIGPRRVRQNVITRKMINVFMSINLGN